MNKKLIQKELINKVQIELDKAREACESSSSYTKSDEAKQEGKYDTRSIEAGYLAGAQLKRVEELQLEVKMLEEIDCRSLNKKDEIVIGALVELETNNRSQTYFISSTSGGTLLNVEGKALLVISVFSPIGSEVLGLQVGDSFEVELGNETREYLVKSVS